ncbi:type II toxin-antitoxin system PemK/MazF family toxin [Tardiphaga sp.]|uniref:type II toxin-antitoxin system PemK/MazF family toxin n=1 Tax=Tardiphaga sp. TaxID=1926292 RepID=UPI00261A01C8|nr:type II toxin-antitoxin system PemK/MazF family toxin [Tardiphaga sp.]MDB5620023.1 growth inhibitor PemK [Tardiphaga sp.]
MRRGEIVSVVIAGDFGKPRPALIVQANQFSDIPSLAVLPLTSDLRNVPAVRIDVDPDTSNGLMLPSQIMVDKIVTVETNKIGARIGQLSGEGMAAVDRALAVFLGFA